MYQQSSVMIGTDVFHRFVWAAWQNGWKWNIRSQWYITETCKWRVSTSILFDTFDYFIRIPSPTQFVYCSAVNRFWPITSNVNSTSIISNRTHSKMLSTLNKGVNYIRTYHIKCYILKCSYFYRLLFDLPYFI